jgi:nucleoside-diphosphate-sugar epimerase
LEKFANTPPPDEATSLLTLTNSESTVHSAGAPPPDEAMSPAPVSHFLPNVDNFCNLIQGNARQRRVARLILFHAINEIIGPMDPTHEYHEEPISVKKLLKGDGCWGTTKMLLGWIIDTVR